MQAFNKGFVYFICLVSAMGGLLFGYDWVVIGGAELFYEHFFCIQDSSLLQGIAMSTALVGCLVGAMMAGGMADKYGRKPLLQMSAVLFTLSAIATGMFNNFTLFNIARFVGGVGIGIASALAPMYIAEISPSKIRGKLVSLNQMTIVLGILAAQIVNHLLARPIPLEIEVMQTSEEPALLTQYHEYMLGSWNGQMGWRWMFWAETLPAALFLLMSFFIPESPRWQAVGASIDKNVERKNEKLAAARATLTRIGGRAYAETELQNIRSAVEADSRIEKGGLGTLFTKRYIALLLLGVIIAVFQQWCGTNVIFNYATKIFADAGYAVSAALFNIVITGIANVVFTFIALWAVDRLGRRTLMLIGAGGLGLIYLILGTCFFFDLKGTLLVVLVVLAIGCYAMTLGPCTWVLLSEMFPNRIRGVAMATCTFALWIGCSTLTLTFPLMRDGMGASGAFWIYSVICLCGFLFFLRRLPETKGKSLEELEKSLTTK